MAHVAAARNATAPAGDLLETIVAATRHVTEARERAVPLDTLERRLDRRPRGDAFREALSVSPAPRVIAECKRRSPSRGILKREYAPASHATSYASAGAAAISVLTEPTFFDGSLDHLAQVRGVVDVPLLRKDFIISDYQLAEAAIAGADAVLLIVGALGDAELRTLLRKSAERGLAALVEVHSREELARALDAGAEIVGVNSRDLRTLSVNRHVLEEVGSLMPRTVVAVAESGINSADDIARLSELGYSAFLIGERLIVEPDPGAALKALRG